MKITAVIDDKIIVKDGFMEVVNDENFWSNYSGIHAIQIDTEGDSQIENKDLSKGTPTQAQIDELSNKFDTIKSEKEEAERVAEENFQNSWDRVRQDRDRWIKNSDKFMIADYPITAEKKTEFETYRTSLRDLPTTYSNEEPRNITFDENGNVSVGGSVVITRPIM